MEAPTEHISHCAKSSSEHVHPAAHLAELAGGRLGVDAQEPGVAVQALRHVPAQHPRAAAARPDEGEGAGGPAEHQDEEEARQGVEDACPAVGRLVEGDVLRVLRVDPAEVVQALLVAVEGVLPLVRVELVPALQAQVARGAVDDGGADGAHIPLCEVQLAAVCAEGPVAAAVRGVVVGHLGLHARLPRADNVADIHWDVRIMNSTP
eukprot:CAMPEP_0113679338 /NCGR_PEP_ID=MMETSP0038_2-20120614/10568_1 /TAXON_ID=2898 /ORGANISM="Cryptomonas paramecium" /LENGTH=206 /DNA_ID=CAMNT_0000597317 /DNA_START=285 /DNA_END=905 /DNA_ORIENTATION=+ /assembly_acc=CAM_ASM_000170